VWFKQHVSYADRGRDWSSVVRSSDLAATVRAPHQDDAEHRDASEAALRTVLAVLGGYRIGGDAAIHATRALRSALHGFVALELAGGFGLPDDIDVSFARMLDMFTQALVSAATPSGRSAAR
jgi:hypothetical protein